MTAAPLHWQTVGQLSEQIHSGQLSPVELMEHQLERVESLDERLHSFRLVSRERAMAGAQAAELALRAGRDAGPLHASLMLPKTLSTCKGCLLQPGRLCLKAPFPIPTPRSCAA